MTPLLVTVKLEPGRYSLSCNEEMMAEWNENFPEKSYLVISQVYELFSRERENDRGEEKVVEGCDNRWDLPPFFLSAKLKCPKPQADNPPKKPHFISSIELKSWCISEDHILVSQSVLRQLFKISAKISRTQNEKLRWGFPICLPLTSSEMSLFSFPKYLMQSGVFRRLQWQGALHKNISISLSS